jgi:hypothetical protein
VKIRFRPHHFLCTLGFQGKGYTPQYVEKYRKIVESLQNDEDLIIEVVAEGDSICGFCPHLSDAGCNQETKVQGIDKNHRHILSLKTGDVLTWAEAKKRLKDKMTLAAFHKACEGCEWKAQGMCESALKKLHGEPHPCASLRVTQHPKRGKLYRNDHTHSSLRAP